MNLTGLTPEQINAITQSRHQGSGLMLNAAAALAQRDVERQKLEAAKPDLVDVELDGKVYTIPRDQQVRALEYGAKVREQTFEEGLYQDIHLPGGATVKGKAADLASITTALTGASKAPSEIARSQAAAALDEAQAGRVPSEIAQNEARGTYYRDMGEAAMTGQRAEQRKMDAAYRLQNVPQDQWLAPEHIADAAIAHSGVLSSMINKQETGGPLKPGEERQWTKALIDLNTKLSTEGWPTDPGVVDAYNSIAAKIDAPVMMLYQQDGKKAKAVPIPLPVKDGVQVTPKMVRDVAKQAGMTEQELLLRIFATLSKEQ